MRKFSRLKNESWSCIFPDKITALAKALRWKRAKYVWENKREEGKWGEGKEGRHSH